MAPIQLEQDGKPYLPEPSERKYPSLPEDEQLRDYLRTLVQAISDYLLIIKNDADNTVAPLNTGLVGTKTYWVSDTNGGAVNRKLTFVNGLLTTET